MANTTAGVAGVAILTGVATRIAAAQSLPCSPSSTLAQEDMTGSRPLDSRHLFRPAAT